MSSPETPEAARERRSAAGVMLTMVALFVLVAFGDAYPWHAVAACAVLIVVWLVITRVKRWWKSGTTAFESIMDEELKR